MRIHDIRYEACESLIDLTVEGPVLYREYIICNTGAYHEAYYLFQMYVEVKGGVFGPKCWLISQDIEMEVMECNYDPYDCDAIFMQNPENIYECEMVSGSGKLTLKRTTDMNIIDEKVVVLTLGMNDYDRSSTPLLSDTEAKDIIESLMFARNTVAKDCRWMVQSNGCASSPNMQFF
jgi:hypothetical protein